MTYSPITISRTLSALVVVCAMAMIFAQPVAAQTAKKLKCNGCVKSKQLKNKGIRGKDIKGGAVTVDKLSAAALAGGREPVEDCGTINQPGSYVLLNDLPGPSGLNVDGGCLVIGVDGVTLDLNGFSIVGDGTGDLVIGDGVFMRNRRNVTVRNGTIRGFVDDGVADADSSGLGTGENHQVSHIRAIDNGGSGILLNGSGHSVVNSFAQGNAQEGISVGSDSSVTGNVSTGNVGANISCDGICALAGNIEAP